MENQQKTIHLGEISGLHGVNGWIKVFTDTQERENIFSYQPWLLELNGGMQPFEVLQWRKQGKTMIAKLKNIESREQARALIGTSIHCSADKLPQLDEQEFYWHQLIGLDVLSSFDKSKEPVAMGVVQALFETGANDVLVVKQMDQTQLVPWILDQVIEKVCLQEKQILVNWDPDF